MTDNPKLHNYVLRKNGYYNLNDCLKNKLDEFNCKKKQREPYSKYFTWDEFAEIFSTVTVLWCFEWRGCEYWAVNEGKEFAFYTEDTKRNYIIFRDTSAKELLLKVEIDSYPLKEIRSEMQIALY